MKPIIFSTPMVKVLLNTKPGVWPAEPVDPGKPFKSQTRRVVKGKVPIGNWELTKKYVRYKPGDILWVRETWATKTGIQKELYFYKAAHELLLNGEPFIEKWTSPIYMPREAARIFLEIKSVKIEHLQNISEEDVIVEGIKHNCLPDCPPCGGSDCTDYITAYRELWDSINGKRKGYSWDDSPWVWVYEFVRLDLKSANEMGNMNKYYTPKEYLTVFNEPWDDRDAVYFVDYADTSGMDTSQRFWRVGTLEKVREYTPDIDNGEVLCATTHCPAPDYFHREEGGNSA